MSMFVVNASFGEPVFGGLIGPFPSKEAGLQFMEELQQSAMEGHGHWSGSYTVEPIRSATSLATWVEGLDTRRNPYLPEAPADGQHDFGQDGKSYRCSRCGVYQRPDVPSTKEVLDAPCLGGWAHSGKMRYAAEERWASESGSANAD